MALDPITLVDAHDVRSALNVVDTNIEPWYKLITDQTIIDPGHRIINRGDALYTNPDRRLIGTVICRSRDSGTGCTLSVNKNPGFSNMDFINYRGPVVILFDVYH